MFIFTLGLTESWLHRNSGTVFPLAPGALVGHYDACCSGFYNASFTEFLDDFLEFESIVKSLRNSTPYRDYFDGFAGPAYSYSQWKTCFGF